VGGRAFWGELELGEEFVRSVVEEHKFVGLDGDSSVMGGCGFGL